MRTHARLSRSLALASCGALVAGLGLVGAPASAAIPSQFIVEGFSDAASSCTVTSGSDNVVNGPKVLHRGKAKGSVNLTTTWTDGSNTSDVTNVSGHFSGSANVKAPHDVLKSATLTGTGSVSISRALGNSSVCAVNATLDKHRGVRESPDEGRLVLRHPQLFQGCDRGDRRGERGHGGARRSRDLPGRAEHGHPAGLRQARPLHQRAGRGHPGRRRDDRLEARRHGLSHRAQERPDRVVPPGGLGVPRSKGERHRVREVPGLDLVLAPQCDPDLELQGVPGGRRLLLRQRQEVGVGQQPQGGAPRGAAPPRARRRTTRSPPSCR